MTQLIERAFRAGEESVNARGGVFGKVRAFALLSGDPQSFMGAIVRRDSHEKIGATLQGDLPVEAFFEIVEQADMMGPAMLRPRTNSWLSRLSLLPKNGR